MNRLLLFVHTLYICVDEILQERLQRTCALNILIYDISKWKTSYPLLMYIYIKCRLEFLPTCTTNLKSMSMSLNFSVPV